MFERRSELEKILAVAEAGKIVAAADRLAMTQPALTRAIARLESGFGAPLFERLPTGVRPTALGATVAEEARRLLRAFEDAEDRIGGALTGRSGCIRATADGLWMQAVMPEAVGRFREAYPEVELRLRSAGRAEGQRLLETGDSDLHCGGIDDRKRLPDHLRREPLPALTMGVVADRHHPLQAGGVTVAALADWPWIDCIADLEPFGGPDADSPSLNGLLDRLHARTGQRAASVLRAGAAGLPVPPILKRSREPRAGTVPPKPPVRFRKRQSVEPPAQGRKLRLRPWMHCVGGTAARHPKSLP